MSTEQTKPENTEEEIEGLGTPQDGSSWGNYPIDTVLIRNESRTVHDVLRRIGQGSFIMDPDFQRDFIWPEDKQSKLIESVLMRIPLPVLYLAEDDQGRMVIVDGLQRLSTFQRFVNGILKLKLPDQIDLNGKKFEDLSPKLKNRIEDCNLVLYIIDAKVPEQARLDIFERVNSGVPLTRQQMRNCLLMGQATRFLKTETNTDLFKNATGGSLSSKTMRDRELVNRFCSFQLLGYESYKGDMDDFLARGLRKMNSLSENELNILSEEFRTSLWNNYEIFEEHAFRRHSENQYGRSVINASLWDVMSTGLSRYSKEKVKTNEEDFRKKFYALLQKNAFVESITYSPNGQKQVKSRFEFYKKMLLEVFGD